MFIERRSSLHARHLGKVPERTTNAVSSTQHGRRRLHYAQGLFEDGSGRKPPNRRSRRLKQSEHFGEVLHLEIGAARSGWRRTGKTRRRRSPNERNRSRPLFAAGTDDEVHVPQTGFTGDEPRKAGAREFGRTRRRGRRRSRSHRRRDRRSRRRTCRTSPQAVAASARPISAANPSGSRDPRADHRETNAVADQGFDLVPEIEPQKPHQCGHFRFRPTPIVARERVEGQRADAVLRRRLDDAPDGFDTGFVSAQTRQSPPRRPPSIAVHDDADVKLGGLGAGVWKRDYFA